MKLAPSKNPEKESKQFGILALVCGIVSLLLWFVGIAALGFGIRGIILSRSVKDAKYLTLSVIGALLGVVAIIYDLIAK